ncbi:MAG: ribonuclease P protein component [bacterium]|nr:ribonuclease P protein component [bacterium]
MFSRSVRLSRGDIESLVKYGKRLNTQCFTLRVLRRDGIKPSRVAVSVSKKVLKKAVDRNRAKRRVREALGAIYANMLPGLDVLVVVRADCEMNSFKQVVEELRGGINDIISLL